MGLTKRKDSYYVEFPVLDDGKTLSLARCVPGAKLKHRLLNGTMPSERINETVMTLGQWAEEYKTIEEVTRLRSYKERCQRINQVLVPLFGSNTLLQDITVKDV